MTKILLVIFPLAILAGGSWLLLNKSETNRVVTVAANQKPHEPISNTAQTSVIKNQTQETAGTQLPPAEKIISSTLSGSTALTASHTSSDTDLSGLATSILTDNQFQSLQNRLRYEPAFRREVITEFRYNTDLDRGKRLAALLGDSNDPAIVTAAAELAYSGDPASQRNGLDLLSRLQPHNNDARDIAIELLMSETSPELLVSTMNVLATPSQNASNQQRMQLTDNLMLLSNHRHPQVRSHSISLLGKWNPEASGTILTQGLNDQDPTVRARSAAAFIGKNNADQSVIYSLLEVAENITEIKTTRQSALYALQKMQLPVDARTRYEQAVITVRRTR